MGMFILPLAFNLILLLIDKQILQITKTFLC